MPKLWLRARQLRNPARAIIPMNSSGAGNSPTEAGRYS